jgi:hypothetical protein
MAKKAIIQSEINVKELKRVITHIIDTNKDLQVKGQTPVALNVIGQAGLGKTSTIIQAAKEIGFKEENIIYLNLSTLQEVGDLIGIPAEEYRLVKVTTNEREIKEKKESWIKEKALTSYLQAGWMNTGDSRMTYIVPEWIAKITGPGVLILDDYTRASQRFTQAVMELILNQKYASWALPQGWTILLSSNPDDGLYNVTDQDPAQKSRYLNVNLAWNAEIWAEWADKNKIDSRCINFILMNKEIVKPEVPEINARSITLFFNSISSITDFNDNLELIQLLGEGSLGTEVTTMFTSFIHNKMDQLISSERILNSAKSFSDIEKEIIKVVQTGKNYRADIAYVLTTRLLNHLQFNMLEANIDSNLIKRLEELITSDALGTDLKFVLGRKLTNMNGKYNALLASDAVIENILN